MTIIQSQRKSRAVLAFVFQQHSKPALLLALYEITILVTYTQLCSLMRALLYCILIYNVKSRAGFFFTSATSKSQHCSWHCTRIQYLYVTTPNNKILLLRDNKMLMLYDAVIMNLHHLKETKDKL